jgi:hypothetical protein
MTASVAAASDIAKTRFLFISLSPSVADEGFEHLKSLVQQCAQPPQRTAELWRHS